MDGQGHERRTLEEEWTTSSWGRLDEKKRHIDRAHIEKAPLEHLKVCFETEPAGQKKKREVLEKGSGGSHRASWIFLGTTREDCSGQRVMESVY